MKYYVFRRPWMRSAAGALDAVGGFFIRSRRFRSQSPKNLLILRLDHLGDVWNITGLPKAVKEHLPGCRVTLLVSNAAAPLLEANPFIDEVMRFDAPWFWKKRGPSLSESALIGQIKKRQFDAALSIRGDIREHWMLYRAGIPRRIGPGITGGGFLLTDEVQWQGQAHESERISAVAAKLGLPMRVWAPEIHFGDGEKDRWEAEWKIKAPGLPQEKILFQLEAGSPAKTWPIEHSAAFINQILNQRGNTCLLLSGIHIQRGEAIRNRVEEKLRSRVFNMAGRFSLRELAALSHHFSLVVAPDTGPAHMLASLGAPTLFLYSGTNRLESWKPLAESATVLHHPVPCSPCGLRSCPVKGHPCLEQILPEKVVQAAVERLR